MWIFKEGEYVHTIKKYQKKTPRCKQSIIPKKPKFEPPTVIVHSRVEKIVFTNAKGVIKKEVKNNRP